MSFTKRDIDASTASRGGVALPSQEKKLLLVPIDRKEKHVESCLESLRPALGIEFKFDIEKGVLKSRAWPTGTIKEYPVPALQWDISEKGIIYRGRREDLPEFLPCFQIPLPRAWFGALFKERKEKRRKIYSCDAYGIETGYMVYDRREAYEMGSWADAMKTLGFALQIEMAVPEPVDAKRKDALLEVSIFRPDGERKRLIKEQDFISTRGRFVAFLRSGDFADLKITEKKD